MYSIIIYMPCVVFHHLRPCTTGAGVGGGGGEGGGKRDRGGGGGRGAGDRERKRSENVTIFCCARFFLACCGFSREESR